MRLSFDLDGVIADTDNGLLALLHQAAREGKPGATDEVLQYYARRPIRLDPRQFTGPEDEFHIITGRVPSAHEITRAWVSRHFGPLFGNGGRCLHLVGTPAVEIMFAEGRDAEASHKLAERKLGAITLVQSQVHFDNNPVIVEYLRKAGVIAVMVGGGLL